MRETIIDRIREDNPEYRPLAEFIEKDPLFRFAESYIYADGYFGPFTAREILEESGLEGRGLTISQAKRILQWSDAREECLSILKDAADSIEDYRETFYVTCDEAGCVSEECHTEHERDETVAEASDIKKARFDYVYEIYGRGII